MIPFNRKNLITTEEREIQRKQNLIKSRINFLAGIYPIGFVFFNTHEGNSFHILDNDEHTFCYKNIYDRPRSIEYRRIIIVKKLSELRTLNLKPSERPRFLFRRTLCTKCENHFIGLFKSEKYKASSLHKRLFVLDDDHVRITKHLLHYLKHPKYSDFPVLDTYIKNKLFKII